MKECDILGEVKTYYDPSNIYSRGSGPRNPQDLRPLASCLAVRGHENGSETRPPAASCLYRCVAAGRASVAGHQRRTTPMRSTTLILTGFRYRSASATDDDDNQDRQTDELKFATCTIVTICVCVCVCVSPPAHWLTWVRYQCIYTVVSVRNRSQTNLTKLLIVWENDVVILQPPNSTNFTTTFSKQLLVTSCVLLILRNRRLSLTLLIYVRECVRSFLCQKNILCCVTFYARRPPYFPRLNGKCMTGNNVQWQTCTVWDKIS